MRTRFTLATIASPTALPSQVATRKCGSAQWSLEEYAAERERRQAAAPRSLTPSRPISSSSTRSAAVSVWDLPAVCGVASPPMRSVGGIGEGGDEGWEEADGFDDGGWEPEGPPRRGQPKNVVVSVDLLRLPPIR